MLTSTCKNFPEVLEGALERNAHAPTPRTTQATTP